MERDNGKMGGSHQGKCIKDTWMKPKGVRFEGGRRGRGKNKVANVREHLRCARTYGKHVTC